ncbi:hypothetical protein MKW94_018676 [Papaver nudicaule]|uniref:HMA domain-containing protein n=1 Tax=Papaver nudicaule TaxID=74823 RepID=A0AA41VQ07_PAPNU|nr:hypothetical protein [Papaver nudicaule]
MQQKIIVDVDFHDDRCRQKAMKYVTCIIGINSISMDNEKKQMTVIGDFDAVAIVNKLRKKNYCTKIVSIGPAEQMPEPVEKPPEKPVVAPVVQKEKEPVIIYPYIPYYPPAHYSIISYEENYGSWFF